jgi:hypothetical protein
MLRKFSVIYGLAQAFILPYASASGPQAPLVGPFFVYAGAHGGFGSHCGTLRRYSDVFDRVDMGKASFCYGPLAGLGYSFGSMRWYAGGEWNLNIFPDNKLEKLTTGRNGSDSIIKNTICVGPMNSFAVHVGKFMTHNILLYAQLGIAMRKLRLKLAYDEESGVGFVESKQKRQKHFMWGVGIKGYFHKHVSIGISYSMVKFRSISHMLSDEDGPFYMTSFAPKILHMFMLNTTVPFSF